MANQRGLKCAIYTRKSCEDGLELEYNSLDAQYDAAASYIRSQVANGWILSPKHNMIDRYAQEIGCAFVLVHHTSKGNQSLKSVTDVGAGAGSQSRAADTHVVLRRHREKDVVVMDSVVRSFKSVSPICLRWTWPVWDVDASLDPTELDGAKMSAQKRTATDEDLVAPIVAFFERLKDDKPIGKTRFLQKAQEKFASRATKDVVRSAFDAALERGHLVAERTKDAPRGQQSTLFMSKGETPVSDEERQLAFLAGIPC